LSAPVTDPWLQHRVVAGISRRSFFDHFDTKADVLLLDLKSLIAEHCAAIAARPTEETLLQAIPAALVDIGQEFVRDPLNRRRLQRFSRTSFGTTQINDAAGRWESAINAQLDGGQRRSADKHRRDRLAVALAVTICRMATIEWLTDGLSAPPANYLRKACDAAADVLSSTAAAQRLTGQ